MVDQATAKMSVVCVVVVVEDATENQPATHNARAKVGAERGSRRWPVCCGDDGGNGNGNGRCVVGGVWRRKERDRRGSEIVKRSGDELQQQQTTKDRAAAPFMDGHRCGWSLPCEDTQEDTSLQVPFPPADSGRQAPADFSHGDPRHTRRQEIKMLPATHLDQDVFGNYLAPHTGATSWHVLRTMPAPRQLGPPRSNAA
jgi:hypothetical protein